MRTSEDLFKKCERDGEDKVRKLLVEKTYCTQDEIPIIQEWLRRKDEEHNIASSSKRDAREEEALSIAKEANSIARTALRSVKNDRIIAIAAIIIAAIAAHEEIKWLISSIISLSKK